MHRPKIGSRNMGHAGGVARGFATKAGRLVCRCREGGWQCVSENIEWITTTTEAAWLNSLFGAEFVIF